MRAHGEGVAMPCTSLLLQPHQLPCRPPLQISPVTRTGIKVAGVAAGAAVTVTGWAVGLLVRAPCYDAHVICCSLLHHHPPVSAHLPQLVVLQRYYGHGHRQP
jgi:hypothetical protein